MADSETSATHNAPRGRPSLVAERRRQIFDAFIDLIAARGLEAVSLDDVARAAGVQRSVVRHYAGNRADLIRDTVEALSDRYERMIRAEIGTHPTADRIVEFLFSDRWESGKATEDRAMDELLREATRDDTTRRRIKATFDLLIDELAAAIQTRHPRAAPQAVQECAFTIVCLAEQNVFMRSLGYPTTATAAAVNLSRRLIDELNASS